MARSDAAGDPAYVDSPLIAPEFLERRDYQTTLAERALENHSLVCLPTGLGKTTVSVLVTAARLDAVGGKALMLAPTKPLVTQHTQFYREALTIPNEEIVTFTGDVSPDDRGALWEDAKIILATPQVIENDLVGNRISLAEVTHCTFDECHRATGDYAYNYIAERYHADARDPLVTGMSASPGDDEERILQVCQNLGIANVEVMTESDADVAEYTHDTEVEWIKIELPETVEEVRNAIRSVIRDRMSALADLGVTNTTDPDVSEREIQQIQGRVQGLMRDDQSEGYKGMSLLAEVRKLRTAVTYVETQSVESFRRYMERQREAARSSGASKADQRMVSDPTVRRAVRMAREYDDLHPKFRRARILIAETLGIHDGERIIVFTESRDTAEMLAEFLDDHFETARFVGQSDTDGSDGMTQREQQDTLDRFRSGEFEVLVSTSVAEEGLDVPEVDLVLFYEPVPTAIRSIQRKGRTGRQSEGRVVVLIAEDTRDEAYFWKSRQDEKRMESELRQLKSVVGDIESMLYDQTGLVEGQEESGGESEERSGGESEERSGGEEGDRQADIVAATADGSTNENSMEDPSSDSSDDSSSEDNADDGNEAREQSDGTTQAVDEDSTVTSSKTRPGANDGQAGLDAFSASGGGASGGDVPDEDDRTQFPVPESDGEVIEIIIDQRELDSAIARDLSTREDVQTGLETLSVGDYVLSDRVVVERKTVADFLDSLVGGDRSVFEQLSSASEHYARPLVVIEGDGLYDSRNIHPRAIHGALASIAVDFGASILQTADEEETADLLESIATREQTRGGREISIHGGKQSRTLAEQQEYVVASIADVGPVTARSLLEHLGSVQAVMTADEGELRAVEGVGDVTAGRIRRVVERSYGSNSS